MSSNATQNDDGTSLSSSSSSSQQQQLRPPLSQPSLGLGSNRAYVITGGTQGLGLAIARVLQQQGAAGLVLVSRTDRPAVRKELTESSSDCVVVHLPTDLADAAQASSVVGRAREALPDHLVLAGLVNAAATTARGNLQTETADGFDRQFHVNARAPFLLTQALAQYHRDLQLKQQQSHSQQGCPDVAVVNIGSCAAHGGAPFIMAYSASKAALVTLTKLHAAELAPQGIRVNAVNMGWCCTDNEDALQRRNTGGADWLPAADASVPLGRILRPTDVACTVAFLLGPASRCVTGSVIDLHPEFPHGLLSVAANEREAGRS